MAGERGSRFLRLAQRAALGTSRRLLLIGDAYGPPPKDDNVITLQEWIEHQTAYGHTVPNDWCGHPICVRAKAWVQVAEQQLAAEQAAMQPPMQGAV
jgi:hypothetical protein